MICLRSLLNWAEVTRVLITRPVEACHQLYKFQGLFGDLSSLVDHILQHLLLGLVLGTLLVHHDSNHLHHDVLVAFRTGIVTGSKISV